MNDIDLYAELGIPRDAGPDAIHAAYRSRAKKAHPDTGGSAEAFERLQLAHAVLSDPDRRKRYDATGSYERVRADNADADALGVIAQLLMQFLGGEEEPSTLNLQAELLREAGSTLAQIAKSLAKSQRMKKRAEKLLGRFKTKDGQATPVETMLQHQIRNAEQTAEKHGQAKAAFERAIEILKGWTFDRELTLAAQSQMYAQAMNQHPLFGMRTQSSTSSFFGGSFS